MAREQAIIRQLEERTDSDARLITGKGVEATSALPFLLEDYAGIATYAGKPIFNQEQVIGQIDGGSKISGKTITFSFFDGPHSIGVYNNPNYGFSEPDGYSPFSDAQKAVAREAMVLWDDLVVQKVVEKNGNGADILFANTSTGPAQAWAYYPGNGYKYQGDVWTATPEVNWTNNWLQYNGYGRTTLIHEAGHALGLSHPGDYNFSDDNDGDGQPDPITYEGDAFYAQDTEQYSIMSYFGPQESGAQPVDVALGLVGNAQTPLLHDILTIQAKYGADPTTRVGNTTYFANSNAGNAVYDLAKNPFPYLSVYDAGGIDTFDFSTADRGVFLDLRPGAFSSATIGSPTLAQANAITAEFNAATDAAQGDFALWTSQAEVDEFADFIGSLGASRLAADTGYAGIDATSHRNISIAYNTIIENATGGSGRDYLVGNHVANRLTGNAGSDILNGLEGDDILIGGGGSDLFVFSDLGGHDRIEDFSSQEGDKINLREAGSFHFGEGAAGRLQITRGEASDGRNSFLVSGDLDGDGRADLLITVVGQGLDLQASDFLL